MSKNTLIIGAGGVGNVVAFKCAMNKETFGNITLASRTKSKCNEIAKNIKKRVGVKIKTEEVDADKTKNVIKLIKKTKADIVINVALPYQDLTIMDACIATKVPYLDTANYEHPDTAKFEYKEQWAKNSAFKEAGIMGLLGSGFDPGATNIFCAYAQKHYFDEIHTIDILDCNAGDHGYPFATNFNPEIN
ncbi:MAG: saccharopine dehydrogenase NADP-binding domain-containing protein, partial [Epsilonproteobacteria bacterium]|nr:saccharopine dehydrogenase NADP-binding domain-containing protein [Campylobacterota bacterium]